MLIGEIEAARGYRASFYMLHTDWYFRAEPSGPPSTYLLDACHRLASLGHEVAIHNNAIAAALRWGGQPAEILERDIAYLRSSGFDIDGSVAHGEQLCHTVAFVNSEVFVECPRPMLGEPDRTLRYEDPATGATTEIALRPVPMAEMGLEYEAGYIGHSSYLSDSSGTWHRPIEEVHEQFVDAGGLLQVLTHPIWWAFGDESYKPRDASVTAFPGSLLRQKQGR